MEWMEFIVVDTRRKCGLKVTERSHIGLKTVSYFEPKREQAGPGELVLDFSTTGFDHSTECEWFSMRPFSEFHLFSHGADSVHASAVFDLNGGHWFMKRLVLTILVVLSLAGAPHGHTFLGTILGTVPDPPGAAVPPARVTRKTPATRDL